MTNWSSRALAAGCIVGTTLAAGFVQNASSAADSCSTVSYFAATQDGSTPRADVLQLNRDAAVIDGRLRLTPSATSRAGSAFSLETVSLADDRSFSVAFSFEIGDNLGWGPFDSGADGIVFVVQPNANTAGSLGGGIGYEGIANSVGIEFDTWMNGDLGDFNDNHVGIDANGSVFSLAQTPAPWQLDGGSALYAWVDFDGVAKQIEVRLSATPERPDDALLAAVVDVAAILQQNDVFIGFTSATGAAASRHDVLSWAIRPCYAPFPGVAPVADEEPTTTTTTVAGEGEGGEVEEEEATTTTTVSEGEGEGGEEEEATTTTTVSEGGGGEEEEATTTTVSEGEGEGEGGEEEEEEATTTTVSEDDGEEEVPTTSTTEAPTPTTIGAAVPTTVATTATTVAGPTTSTTAGTEVLGVTKARGTALVRTGAGLGDTVPAGVALVAIGVLLVAHARRWRHQAV